MKGKTSGPNGANEHALPAIIWLGIRTGEELAQFSPEEREEIDALTQTLIARYGRKHCGATASATGRTFGWPSAVSNRFDSEGQGS